LFTARRAGIKTALINANLHEKSLRFHPLLRSFNQQLFLQLDRIVCPSRRICTNLNRLCPQATTSIAPDTRFTQIVQRSKNNTAPLLPQEFAHDMTLVLGSIIPSDYEVVQQAIRLRWPRGEEDLKQSASRIVAVPHETGEREIAAVDRMLRKCNLSPVRYSTMHHNTAPDCVIVDRVGILADLYKWASLAYVGAGFGAGVHSVVEPAVYGVPTAFGPKFHILDEAIALSATPAATVVNTAKELASFLHLPLDPHAYAQSRKHATEYVLGAKRSSEELLQTVLS
jgi:3-deoxy-D-manno-octulosonic-acid transferase